MRQQVVRRAHRRRHQALEQLAARAPGPPRTPTLHMPVPMMFMPSRPGHHPVDVARTRHGHQPVGRPAPPLRPAARLEHVVDHEAADPALGPARIELVGHRMPGHHEQWMAPLRSAASASARSTIRTRTPFSASSVAMQSPPARRRRSTPTSTSGCPCDPEREPERTGEQHREREHPEHRLRLAQELAEPREVSR